METDSLKKIDIRFLMKYFTKLVREGYLTFNGIKKKNSYIKLDIFQTDSPFSRVQINTEGIPYTTIQ